MLNQTHALAALRDALSAESKALPTQPHLKLFSSYANAAPAFADAYRRVKSEFGAVDWRTQSQWERKISLLSRSFQRYPEWDRDQLYRVADALPNLLLRLSRTPADVVELAHRFFHFRIPGQLPSALMRALDAKYWRRALWRRHQQHREALRLDNKEVGGRSGIKYASNEAVLERAAQLRRQEEFVRSTGLAATIDGEEVVLPLEQVVSTASARFARVYAFVSALDRVAVDNNLSVAMITATLEGEWHPNPTFASKTHWNGKTPAEANAELGARWERVRRDLADVGVKVSGIWAGEPHSDGCPHRHFWTVYRPEHLSHLIRVFAKHFPGTPGRAASVKVRHPSLGDIVFDTPNDAQSQSARMARQDRRDPKKQKTEGAQVEIAVIDRSRGSGASYAFKYLAMAMSIAEEGDTGKAAQLARIDAHRAIWRMRSFQLFGVKSCLGLWDELRRVDEAPSDDTQRELWLAARGGAAAGRIGQDADGKPVQRGDARKFLLLLGGIAVLEEAKAKAVALRELRERALLSREIVVESKCKVSTVPTETAYLETRSKVVGVETQERILVVEYAPDEDGVLEVFTRGPLKGAAKPARMYWTSEAVGQVVTRLHAWRLVPLQGFCPTWIPRRTKTTSSPGSRRVRAA